MMKELEKAHQDYEERKQRLITNLHTLKSNLKADPTVPEPWWKWLETAIEFINERQI